MLSSPHQRLRFLLAAGVLSLGSGCLSLGGRETHVHDNPETNARISALETRISALEQVITRHAGSAEFVE